MSHFANLQVLFKDAACLKTALMEVFGATEKDIVESSSGVRVRGYNGRTAFDAPDCEIVLQREAVQRKTGAWNVADIGFKKLEDGTYRMYFDPYETGIRTDNLASDLGQAYGKAAVKKAAYKKGYKVKNEMREKDGSIRLTLSRTVYGKGQR